MDPQCAHMAAFELPRRAASELCCSLPQRPTAPPARFLALLVKLLLPARHPPPAGTAVPSLAHKFCRFQSDDTILLKIPLGYVEGLF